MKQTEGNRDSKKQRYIHIERDEQSVPGASRRHKGGSRPVMIAAVAGAVCLAAVAGMLLLRMNRSGADGIDLTPGKKEEAVQTVTVDGVDITGLDREAAKLALESKYPWAMKVTYGDQVYEVNNLLEARIDRLLDQIEKTASTEAQSYTLDTTGTDEEAAAEAAAAAALWDKPAVNGGITEFNQETGTFVLGGAENGAAVDQEKLASDISQAMADKSFDKSIAAPVAEVEPDSAGVDEQSYKILSTYETKTTANSGRNKNIDLAAQAINGTILKPGEEFSFNGVVGQRTVKKGYHEATAYNNGEVVQEVGGGVCQVSSTLYNATVFAGLEITNRKSHTFQPSYVTPGEDATVSWEAPDFCFKNNSDTAIGILAHYADRKLTISIYGRPILEEGVEYALQSKKVANLGVPAPTYVEDPALAFGQEVVKSNGSSGSKWETRLVITKNGEVVSQEVDHTATYKGHAPVIARNSAAVPIPETPPVETAPVETAPTGPVEVGPGVQPTAPVETTAPQGPGAAPVQSPGGDVTSFGPGA